MMNLQNKITELTQQTAIKKISLVLSNTGAIVNERIYKGNHILKSEYEKGKITIFDGNGKKVEIINLAGKSKPENKKADQKKHKDDKSLPELPDASV